MVLSGVTSVLWSCIRLSGIDQPAEGVRKRLSQRVPEVVRACSVSEKPGGQPAVSCFSHDDVMPHVTGNTWALVCVCLQISSGFKEMYARSS